MSGRPTVAEERWIEVGRRLRVSVDPAVLAARTGGWRITGTLARIALFILGVAAAGLLAALLVAILGSDGSTPLAVGGGIAVVVAEFLIRNHRLYAAGFEEGLWTAGSALLALWLHEQLLGGTYDGGASLMLVLGTATCVAGLRIVNPFVTLLGTVALVDWLSGRSVAHALDDLAGRPFATLAIGVAVAVAALVASGRRFERPSTDRMLDWIAAGVPAVAWLGGNGWGAAIPGTGAPTAANLPAIAMLAALAIAAVVTGLRRRRHGPLLCGMLAGACAAVEIARSTGWPAEVLLIGGGLLVLMVGAMLDRRLRKPWRGYTSAPLDESAGSLDLLGAALAGAQLPAAGAPAPTEPGRGGRFGGGGASGDY
jgi:hypothetical protein